MTPPNFIPDFTSAGSADHQSIASLRTLSITSLLSVTERRLVRTPNHSQLKDKVDVSHNKMAESTHCLGYTKPSVPPGLCPIRSHVDADCMVK